MTRGKGGFIWTTARLNILAEMRAAHRTPEEIGERLNCSPKIIRERMRAELDEKREAAGWTPLGGYRMVAMIEPRKEE